jgi:hypothetical protein
MNKNETYKLLFGHAHKGQAITTRYFAKKQNELVQIELLRRFANSIKKYIMREQTVLSFVQL